MPQEDSKPLLGILPIYHFSLPLQSYQPLTPGAKFRIAADDSLALGTFVLAGLVAGESQWTNDNRSIGQGVAGFGRYFRRRLWRSGHRQLHDRGHIPNASTFRKSPEPRPPLPSRMRTIPIVGRRAMPQANSGFE